MTREEAIAYGRRVIDLGLNDEAQAFCALAIKVLEQQPSERMEERTETHECDCISRKLMHDMGATCIAARDENGDLVALGALDILPSVNLQPKTGQQAFHVMKGKWMTQWNAAHQKEYYYCSECREEFSYDGETGIKMNDYKYCPNCGSYNGGTNEHIQSFRESYKMRCKI